MAGISVCSNLTVDDIMKFSKKKNSPIYTPNTDSDPMDRFSAIQDIENQYIKFYYSEKKLKYIILYNDPFHSFKSDYAINAILIPETYNRAEKIKNSVLKEIVWWVHFVLGWLRVKVLLQQKLWQL